MTPKQPTGQDYQNAWAELTENGVFASASGDDARMRYTYLIGYMLGNQLDIMDGGAAGPGTGGRRGPAPQTLALWRVFQGIEVAHAYGPQVPRWAEGATGPGAPGPADCLAQCRTGRAYPHPWSTDCENKSPEETPPSGAVPDVQ